MPAAADTLLVANKSSATLTLVDADSAAVIAVLPTDVGPHEVDVSPDGRTAVVANYGFLRSGHSLTVIEVPSATVVGTIDLGAHTRPHGVAWLKDGRRVAVTAEGSKHLLLVDVAARQITAAYPTGQQGSHMVAVADGDPPVALLANTGSGSITRIDLRTGEAVSRPTGAGAEGIAVQSAHGRLWVALANLERVIEIDTDTWTTVRTFDAGEEPDGMAWSPLTVAR